MVWLPIDTAPRDGQEILVAFGGYDGPCPLVLRWIPDLGWEIPDTGFGPSDEATHWMHLPEPPTTEAAA